MIKVTLDNVRSLVQPMTVVEFDKLTWGERGRGYVGTVTWDCIRTALVDREYLLGEVKRLRLQCEESKEKSDG